MNPNALDPARRCLPFAEWPEADQALWARLRHKASPLDDPGPGAQWREVTDQNRRIQYGRWLNYLGRSSPAFLAQDPVTRLSRTQVAAYVDCLAGQRLKPRTIIGYLVAILIIAQFAGKGRDWSWLRNLVNRLDAEAREQTGPSYKVPPIGQLFQLAVKYMQTCANKPPHLPLDVHVRFRDGLMIAVLCARALRRRNLTMIEIGRHLTETSEGYRLVFTAPEIKTGQFYDAALPKAIVPYTRTYLATHRPALLQGAESQTLWIANTGRPMTGNSIRTRVQIMTKRLLGYELTPHAFRHAGATTIAMDHPDLLHTTSSLLHHSGPDTAQRYYNLASSTVASRRYQTALYDLAKETA